MIPKSEILTKDYLKKHGYYYIRAGRSFGIWDFLASNNKELLYIQAKCNQRPRRIEMARLKNFCNHPNIKCIKKQIWIWKKGKKKPSVKEL